MSLFDSMKCRFVILFFVIASISSCVKGPSYPIVPAITFKSVSSELIKSGYADTITFSFTDGDGDIAITPSTADTCDQCGLKHGDSTCLRLGGFNVFLIDSRDTCVGTFASPYIIPDGPNKAIAGEISVIRAIDSKKCFVAPTPGCPKDTFTYSIILRDRAGHFSNTVKTVPIVVDGE